MNKIKLGVIFGGQSTEHDVSIVSGSSVIKNLNKEKYEIYPIYISKDGVWYHYTKDIDKVEEFYKLENCKNFIPDEKLQESIKNLSFGNKITSKSNNNN